MFLSPKSPFPYLSFYLCHFLNINYPPPPIYISFSSTHCLFLTSHIFSTFQTFPQGKIPFCTLLDLVRSTLFGLMIYPTLYVCLIWNNPISSFYFYLIHPIIICSDSLYSAKSNLIQSTRLIFPNILSPLHSAPLLGTWIFVLKLTYN